jgi:hypothetical protein
MAEYALSHAPYPGVNTPYKRGVLTFAVISFAAGAPSIVEARSGSGWTIADGATGAYTGTAPVGERGVMWTQVQRGATNNDATVDVVSYVPSTGAFTLQYHVNGASADAADGSELWLFALVEGG